MADLKKPGPEAQAAAERFISAWQTSANVDEVAKKLERTKRYVYGRAAVFRAAGIELRRFQPGRPRTQPLRPERFAHLDLKRLRSLALELADAATPKPKRRMRANLREYLLTGEQADSA